VQNRNKMAYSKPKEAIVFPQHIPVLSKQLVFLINPELGDTIIDCTSGLGGHAKLFLEKIGKTGHYIGIDQDEEALHYCKQNLSKSFSAYNIDLYKENFKNICSLLKQKKITRKAHLIADIGISSLQLDSKNRGFSFKTNSPLDMRMDQNSDDISAKEFLATSSQNILEEIFMKYGEIRRTAANRIAEKIIEKRKTKNLKTTFDLRDLIEELYPDNRKLNTLVFQAIRIHINKELENLKELLEASFEYLEEGSNIGIISFHSLEDRIVKQFFKHWSKKCVCSKDILICECRDKHPKRLKLLTKKIITPSTEEIKTNKRSRSSKLRVAQIIKIK